MTAIIRFRLRWRCWCFDVSMQCVRNTNTQGRGRIPAHAFIQDFADEQYEAICHISDFKDIRIKFCEPIKSKNVVDSPKGLTWHWFLWSKTYGISTHHWSITAIITFRLRWICWCFDGSMQCVRNTNTQGRGGIPAHAFIQDFADEQNEAICHISDFKDHPYQIMWANQI